MLTKVLKSTYLLADLVLLGYSLVGGVVDKIGLIILRAIVVLCEYMTDYCAVPIICFWLLLV